MTSLGDLRVVPGSIFDMASDLRTQTMLAPEDEEKRLNLVCIHLIMAISHLQTEPANIVSVSLLKREIDLLRSMSLPRVSLLAEWCLAVALLLQEFATGVIEPMFRTRPLDEAARQFEHVAKLAIAWDDRVRASLAYSLAAEIRTYTREPERAVALATEAAKFDTGEDIVVLAGRRRFNEAIITSNGTANPEMALNYTVYLYTQGDLAAALNR